MYHLFEVAAESIRASNPRANYALNVVTGWQNLSGSDLAGKARKWGSYIRGRQLATKALLAAGCVIGYCAPYGKKVALAPVCVDDFGNFVHVTVHGRYLVPPSVVGDRWQPL